LSPSNHLQARNSVRFRNAFPASGHAPHVVLRQVGGFITRTVARNLLLTDDEGGLWAGSGGSAAVSFQSRLLTGYQGQNPAPFFELYIAAKPFMGNLFFHRYRTIRVTTFEWL
jgi:hypothetical protein